jgi:hypothetical protein
MAIFNSYGKLPEGMVTGWWCNNHLEKYERQWEGLSHCIMVISPTERVTLALDIYIYI